MHITSTEANNSGVHILTSIIEGDGAVELASEKAEVTAKIISVQRTISGGLQVQTAVTVTEPQPEAPAPAPPTEEEAAIAYFIGKGYSEEEAKADVEKFGVTRVLALRDKQLDEELKKALDQQ